MSPTPDEMSDVVIFYTSALNAFGKNKPVKIKKQCVKK